jgi:hypothetical protein
MQRMVSSFLILLFILGLISCSSWPVEKQNEKKLMASDNDSFVDPAIVGFMEKADHVKLQGLVATAQPYQIVKWMNKTGARLEFRSLGIYVNTQGQGCRNYHLLLSSGFLRHRHFSYHYTACRDNQGNWQVVKAKQ